MEVKDILDFQVKRSVTTLYKQFLVVLEDLQEEHNRFLKKSNLPDEANYLDQAKIDYLRKKVLDSGNNCEREIKTVIDHFYSLINK